MERFCDKCGTLVSGDGAFCPQCGAPMASAVNLGKPAQPSGMDVIMPGSVKLGEGETPQTEDYFSGSSASPANNVDDFFANTSVPKMPETMGTAQDAIRQANERAAQNNVVPPMQNTYSSPAPIPTPAPSYNQPGNYAQMPNYPQSSNVTHSEEMTVGQWVGTILLGSCLGIISFILLIVWGFGSNTPQPKKNYAKAMFWIQIVAIGIYVLFLIGMVACTGTLFGSDFWDEIYY